MNKLKGSPRRYGAFDDHAQEYVITTPHTPAPWINYLGNNGFYGLFSHTGGGYSFWQDAKLRRLTRYRYNNIPADSGGRYFYLKQGHTIWSPGYRPANTELDSFECRHGTGYSKINSRLGAIRSELLSFVPLDTRAEVHRLRLSNEGEQPQSMQLFSFVEWCLWNADEDASNFQRNLSVGEVTVDGSLLVHHSEYRERRDHYAFFSVNQAISGFDTDRDAFLGPQGTLACPDVVCRGQSRNSVADGWSPIASHQLDIELAPGESRDLIFVLGYIEVAAADKWADNPPSASRQSTSAAVPYLAPAHALAHRFADNDAVERHVNALKHYWQQQLQGFHVASPEPLLDRMVNIWNPYQNMVTFNLSRSASYFESGIGRGMGFRDSNQDLIGVVHLEPTRARQRILDLAATQKRDGSAYHQYQPLTKQGNSDIGGNFNDDPMWLVFAVSGYVRETGDLSILAAPVAFDDQPDGDAALFDHLSASFQHVLNKLGPHQLPLIGRADWNDCLNLNCFSDDPDQSFQITENRQGDVAESVMIAGQFVLFGREYQTLCEQTGRTQAAAAAADAIAGMVRAVETHGWDGDWFLRAYDALGRPVGSRSNQEGQIFIESQGFCVMADIGLHNGKARSALDAVADRLATAHGIVVQQPAYSRYYPEYGEISSYPPGYKENAGIFCHANPWIMIAETRLGRGTKAFDYYTRIAPAYREQNDQQLHRQEPYIYAQMIAGKDAKRHGEAKNSWLTGTASWNYYAVTQFILGIRPELDGLRIDPCIPASWAGFSVIRRFRDATYHIEISNPDGLEQGVRRICVDGQWREGNLIPVLSGEVQVKIIMQAL
ncbi:GH36-type glycosyl hydrolase domain-containing protein [Ferrimonas pelagia]